MKRIKEMSYECYPYGIPGIISSYIENKLHETMSGFDQSVSVSSLKL